MREASPRFARDLRSAFSEAGWPAILIPEEKGGLGLDLTYAVSIFGEIGRHPVPEPLLASAGQVPAILSALPDGDLRDALLHCVASGDLILDMAWQEPGQADGETGIPQTSAGSDGDSIVLTGTKVWVAPGNGADGWIVTATTGQYLGNV